MALYSAGYVARTRLPAHPTFPFVAAEDTFAFPPYCSGMVQVSLKLTFADDLALGPGKIRLLELIRETGSISAAGRAMGMSYRRAWLLVDDLNRSFKTPLVVTQLGGTGGGGAELTPLGADIARRYRAIEAKVRSGSRAHLTQLENAVAR